MVEKKCNSSLRQTFPFIGQSGSARTRWLRSHLAVDRCPACLLLTQHGKPSSSPPPCFLKVLMHSFLRLRHSSILSTGASITETMAYRGAACDYRFESSASSPSLRASEPTTPAYSSMANGADGDGAGNVKVVVRVRQFVQRGTISSKTVTAQPH